MKTELMVSTLAHPVVARARPGSGAKGWSTGRAADRFTASVRVPVRRANRDYLRTLRAAELAVWEAAENTASTARAEASLTGPQVLSPVDERLRRWETASYALLAAGALFALGAAAQIGLQWLAR